jgi:HTH-type transcriptional regulator / antitoxin HigA
MRDGQTTATRTWTPNWVSPPGDTVADLLDERGWTQADFAERTGFTVQHLNDLIAGRAPITAETAAGLDRVLGGTVEFWLTREARYRAALVRPDDPSRLRGCVLYAGPPLSTQDLCAPVDDPDN